MLGADGCGARLSSLRSPTIAGDTTTVKSAEGRHRPGTSRRIESPVATSAGDAPISIICAHNLYYVKYSIDRPPPSRVLCPNPSSLRFLVRGHSRAMSVDSGVPWHRDVALRDRCLDVDSGLRRSEIEFLPWRLGPHARRNRRVTTIVLVSRQAELLKKVWCPGPGSNR